MFRWIKPIKSFLNRIFGKKETVVVSDTTIRETLPEDYQGVYTQEDMRGRTMLYYQALYDTMEIKNEEVVERVVERIERNKDRYMSAEILTGVDWRVIAVFHNMEASGDFSRQILNGERWNRKTRLVPKGFGPWDSFEESCIDAFKRHPIKDLSLPELLKKFEKYNGWGYVRKNINSPYLWSYTNHYTKGKYVADGKYSATAVSKQVGAAALLKMLGY